MKNIYLISNGVLFIAVVVLYVLHFTGPKPPDKETKQKPKPLNIKAPANESVAYIELDTILQDYRLYIELQEELTNNIKRNEKRINTQMQNIEKEFQQLEYQRQNILITTPEFEKKMGELQVKYQRLQQEQMAIQQQLLTQEQNANRRVINAISEYLDKIKTEGGFSMILGVTYGSVLYANPELNITQEVLKGLNEEYSKNTGK